MEALARVEALERSLGRDSQLRCLVLTYTVGCKAEDRWAVPQRALELFGPERVRWQLLSEERLWRINGKKEQDNPMPLDRLGLKADCRFYVPPGANREEIRAGYRALASERHDFGWDHLAYGVIAIEARGAAAA